MEKLIVLGTGWAMAKKTANTSFIIENNKKQKLLVDTMGGNIILSQLEKANIDLSEIHDIFISHKHTDHVLGILWIIRELEFFYIRREKYEGNLTIYCHKELEKTIRGLCELTLKQRFIDLLDKRILFRTIEDKEELEIIGYKVKVLDIHSKGDLQYGFKITLENGKTMAFMGDEPLHDAVYDEIRNCDYLCHESDCLDAEADIYTPYKFNHGTAKTAALVAKELNIKSLILWHTKDYDLEARAQKHREEAKMFFDGNIIVPEDLDIIEL